MFTYFPQKTSFRASKQLHKSRTQKTVENVNYATIEETEKMREIMVWSKWNRQVATNIDLYHEARWIMKFI